jgi:hypothetical protein
MNYLSAITFLWRSIGGLRDHTMTDRRSPSHDFSKAARLSGAF